MNLALQEGMKIFADALPAAGRRTIPVRYETSETLVHIWTNDPEQDARPGKTIQFLQAPEPYDPDAPINEEDVPF